MAYPIENAIQTIDAGAVSSKVAVLPAHAENDVLFVFASQDGLGTLSESGATWSTAYTSSGLPCTALFYKVAGATTEPNPTINSTASNDVILTAFVIRDADTTTPVNQCSGNTSNTYSVTCPSVTTTADDCLLIHLMAHWNIGRVYTPEPWGKRLIRGDNGSAVRHDIVWTNAITLGATDTQDFIAASITATLHGITLAINNKTGGVIKPSLSKKPASVLHPMFAFGYGGPYSTNSTTDRNDGASVVSLFPTIQGLESVASGLSAGGFLDGETQNASLANNAAHIDKVMVSMFNLSSSQNLTGKHISLTVADAYSMQAYETYGHGFGLASSAGQTEMAVWKLDAKDTSPSSNRAQLPFIIDPSTTPHDSSGVFDITDVTGVIIASCLVVNRQGNTFGWALIHDEFSIVGGDDTDPASFKICAECSDIGSLALCQNQFSQTKGQYLLHQNVTIGDANDDVIFNSGNQSFAFHDAYDEANKNTQSNIAQSSLTMAVKAASSATKLNIVNTTGYFGNFHNLVFDSSVVNAGEFSVDGFTAIQATITLYPGVSYSGMTSIGGPEITHAGASLSGVTVDSVASGETAGVTITSEAQFAAVVTGATFRNNTNAPAIRITGNQSHTGSGWADPGLTVSGNTVDIEYTGATNFSIQSATSLTVSNTGAGVLTIVTPVTQLEVTSNIASSDIKIFETGTQTIEASATGTSASTSVAGTYDWTVQKAGYLPQRGTGVVLGTSNVTVSVTLIKDPVYSASHGLAYTTDFTYNGITKKLTCVTRKAGRDFYSAMIDAFIAQSSLDNTPFPLTAVGIDSIFFNDDAELLDATSQDNWFDAGIRYINSSGTTTAEWCSIKSSGSIPAGVTGRYQTGTGTGTTALRTTGAVNQIIQIYGDATHGNFDHRSYLVIKFQANPYVDTRSDILSLAGVATLEPFEYSVAIEPTALDITAGDSGAVLTLVDHTAAPITVGGKSFSYEIQDGGTNSAEAILRAWDYNIAQTGTYQGTDTFNLPEFIAQSGSNYETRRGIVETKGSTLYGCYVSRGGSDHPDFTRHQSDDGTYYDKPVTANITITNLPDDVGGNTRLQIYNVTTATEYYSDDPAGTGYSASYTDGVGISAGDSIRIRFAHLNGATSFESGQTFATATSTGFSVDGSTFITANAVYADNALNGSTITKFTADFVNDELDVSSAANFTGPETWAFFCMTLTTANGINEWWGGYEAIDIGNYRNNSSIVSMYFDETFGSTKRQTDSSRIFRSDGVYPVKDPTTTGYGVDINWQVPVYVKEVNTGTAVNKSTVIEALTDQGYTSVRATKIDQTDEILADTTELQANQGNWLTATGFATTNPDNAGIAAIKAKTDQMVYTVPNQLDANTKSINDGEVTGAGTEADPWRKTGVTP